MSLDHAKKSITEKLLSDAGFRDRVADFILYRGFLYTSSDLKHFRSELLMQCSDYDEDCSAKGCCSPAAKKQGGEDACPFRGMSHGYEHWVG